MIEKFVVLMLIGRDEEEGATAVEYGLMIALIAVAIIGVVTLLGQRLDAMFQGVVNALPGGGGGV
jgi:pilus assembly protein Flp/PilA